MESIGRFEAALPVTPQPTTSVGSLSVSFVRTINETATIGTVGVSH